MRINAGNLKKGEFIAYRDKIWQIHQVKFNYRGRGSALMTVKIKDLVRGKTETETFKSDQSIEVVEIEVLEMQFLYQDKQFFYFMDERDFNQYRLAKERLGFRGRFLKEGEKYYVYLLDGNILNIRFPDTVVLKVIKADAAVKGDRVSGAKKPVVVETGIKVLVPLFIKQGEQIVVNPETGEYVERAKSS